MKGKEGELELAWSFGVASWHCCLVTLPPVLGSPLAKCLFLFHSSHMLQLTPSPFNYLFTQTQEDSKLRGRNVKVVTAVLLE